MAQPVTPAQLEALARAAEKKYGLPQGMLVAQLRTESSDGTNNYNATTGATGPMQFMPATAKAYGVNPNDPASAIDGAGHYMADNLKQAKGNPAEALKLYYGGADRSGWKSKTHAYPGQVASNWDDGDAFEAASNFAPTQAPDPDADSFEKAASLAPNKPAGAPSGSQATHAPPGPKSAFQQALAQPDEPTQPLNQSAFKQGLAKLSADPDLSMDDLESYYRSSGADTTSPEWKAAAQKFLATPPGLRVTNPDFVDAGHSTSGDVASGFMQGLDDVFSSIRQGGQWVDRNIPGMNAVDTALGHVFPGVDPANNNRLINVYNANRDAFDNSFGNSLTAKVGRVGGNIAGSVPLMAAGGGAAMAGARAVGVEASPIVSFMAGNAGRGNMLLRGSSLAANGATQGVAGAALTASQSDQPLSDQMETGAGVGAVLGPLAGAASGGLNRLKRLVAPGVDAATARLAQLAKEKYGIDLEGGQITNNPLIRRVDAQLETSPGTGVAGRNAGQRDQFTNAVGRTFGADSPRLTPEVMSAARKNLGAQFDQIAARTPIRVDDPFLNDLAGIETDAKQVVTDQEAAPIMNQLHNVLGKVGPDDSIPGDVYQALTRKGSPLEVAERSANPNIAHYAGRIRDALDDAMERSANPEDLAQLRNVRLQYKNMKTIDPLVAGSVDGTISPAALMQRVKTNFKDKAYSGADDLGELAAIGQRFLKPPSSSGTVENEYARKLMGGVQGGLGLGTGIILHQLGAPIGTDLAGGLAVAGAGSANTVKNIILRKALGSQAYRNRLVDTALNDNGAAPGVNALNGLPPALYVTGNDLTRKSASGQPQ